MNCAYCGKSGGQGKPPVKSWVWMCQQCCDMSRATVIHRCPRCSDVVYPKNAVAAPSQTRTVCNADGCVPDTAYYCKHCAGALKL